MAKRPIKQSRVEKIESKARTLPRLLTRGLKEVVRKKEKRMAKAQAPANQEAGTPAGASDVTPPAAAAEAPSPVYGNEEYTSAPVSAPPNEGGVEGPTPSEAEKREKAEKAEKKEK